MYPRDPGPDASFLKWAHTQVAVGARVASYHDEIKLSLPAMWTPMHHLLFTFFHVDLQTKLEAPKPVSSFLFNLTFCFLLFVAGCLGLFVEIDYPCQFSPGGNWICSSSFIITCSVCFLDLIFLSLFRLKCLFY